ncbi:inter-alpha-trypsin inhibitor heavy chain H3-like isoform X2 [Amblyraja radiata]|uniref:inter-alpha-trypsin inhibitor heavy chain H3-like isoform X2 n=1 Tax=Amblyraja radiata TaxID=386614 RepID=UPI0014031F41|nr:inter-alpha-trypsin inhibitor heavy chain H3-like isoform X2 [Amblyraja radiata]
MKQMLFYLLLLSLLTLTSTYFIITESEDPGIAYGSLSPNLQPLNVKKRSLRRLTHKSREGIEVYSLKIDSKITSRFAHNVITSRVVNRGLRSSEAHFEVELPKTAFITNFTMTINGVKYTAEVKEKAAAQKQYQEAVSRGETTGLVKASGRKTEIFTVSVNVAPTKKVLFELIYEELLQRKLGKYEMVIKVKPMQLVNHFQIDAHIFEPKGIAFLNANATFLTKDLENALVKNISGTKAHVSFKPTLDQQRKCPNCGETLLHGDFILQYDVNRDLSSGDIQIVNGYFVHHFAPTSLPTLPKNVVFVIDRSFSMRGLKFKQMKVALFRILEDMDANDHFTIIIFDSTVDTWRASFVQATPENVLQAKKYIHYLQLGAETNINDSLLLAVTLLDTAHKQKQLSEKSVSMIILLTDGDPNVGEKNPSKIQINVKNAIMERYSLYCLGFGFDVDYNFLEKMALANGGVARLIYADSDAALQLQGFYEEVANPLLLDVELLYLANAISELTEATFRQFYGGSEIVVAGKISDNNLDVFMVEIRAQTANGNLSLEGNINISETESILEHQKYIFGDFTERLWGYLTIQQLLKQSVSAASGEKTILKDKALELSLKYNFVTPLTSMVVTKPEEDQADRILMADKPTGRANLQTVQSGRVSPRQIGLRASAINIPGSHIRKTGTIRPRRPEYSHSLAAPQVISVDGDPHFIIPLQKQHDAACFNFAGKPGLILNLVNDPFTDIQVNGQLIGDKKTENNQKITTYFGKFGLENRKINLRISVTTEVITIFYNKDKTIIPWSTTATVMNERFTISIMKERNLTLVMGDEATFVIVLHRVWKYHPLHRDFLGFYTLDSHRLSNMTHGLLGQFYHGIDAKVYDIHSGSDPQKPEATMIVKGLKLSVTRGWQKDYRLDSKIGANISCWFVHNNGKGFIDGTYTDYLAFSLFDSAML